MQWDITDTVISIHALLAESDALRSPRIALMVGFLSTLSLRRATTMPDLCQRYVGISIHALLAESDPSQNTKISMKLNNFYPRSPCGERLVVTAFPGSVDNFYPRSPCGERPITITITCIVSRFLSTLSLRRATVSFSA